MKDVEYKEQKNPGVTVHPETMDRKEFYKEEQEQENEQEQEKEQEQEIDPATNPRPPEE